MTAVKTQTLAEFLLARIAEDEATAKAADAGRWVHQDKAVTFEFWSAEDGDYDWNAMLRADTRANGEHIAAWSPARVLADCEALRKIVEHYRYEIDEDYKRMPEGPLRPFRALRYLALPYASHPDYREEWKP